MIFCVISCFQWILSQILFTFKVIDVDPNDTLPRGHHEYWDYIPIYGHFGHHLEY